MAADTEAKLSFLIDEARRAQERLDDLDQRLEDEHAGRVNALNELRQDLDAAIREGVETSRVRFMRLRRLGLAFLWSGAACLAVANLV